MVVLLLGVDVGSSLPSTVANFLKFVEKGFWQLDFFSL